MNLYLYSFSLSGPKSVSRMVLRAESLGSLRGIQIASGAPTILQLKDILTRYSSWSRQEINRNKSSIVFNGNTLEDPWIPRLLGFRPSCHRGIVPPENLVTMDHLYDFETDEWGSVLIDSGRTKT